MMLTWEATWPELEQPPWLAILPLGSIEQHGPHLPIATDWLVACHIAEGVARELDAWLLPSLPYSCSQEHQEFPGTITLRPATLAVLLTDIVVSLGRMGVPRLVILNYHGGNWALKPITRDVNRQQDAVSIYTLNATDGAPREGRPSDELHAGVYETSNLLHIRPESVHPDRAVDCVPDVPFERLDQVGIRAITPQGVWGRPTEATAERGAQNVEWMIHSCTRRIREAYTFTDRVKR